MNSFLCINETAIKAPLALFIGIQLIEMSFLNISATWHLPLALEGINSRPGLEKQSNFHSNIQFWCWRAMSHS